MFKKIIISIFFVLLIVFGLAFLDYRSKHPNHFISNTILFFHSIPSRLKHPDYFKTYKINRFISNEAREILSPDMTLVRALNIVITSDKSPKEIPYYPDIPLLYQDDLIVEHPHFGKIVKDVLLVHFNEDASDELIFYVFQTLSAKVLYHASWGEYQIQFDGVTQKELQEINDLLSGSKEIVTVSSPNFLITSSGVAW